MTTFAILLGGSLLLTERLSGQLRGARFIAADGGMHHAEMLGIVPELWVGDFDSTTDGLIARYPDVPRQTYPAEKDLTDGEIAIEAALERGATRIILVGALGGERSDHGLAHLVHAAAMRGRGIDVALTSGEEEAYPLVAGEWHVDLPPASLFSIIGFTALSGLDIVNARYPLSDFSLPFGSSRTISNVAEGAITVRLAAGTAILLARPHDFTGV
jgi:thiamine pyrophosphokinase